MKVSGHRRPDRREGFVLILVLAMLALIAIIGVGFANYSGGQRIGAEARDVAFQNHDDGSVLADMTAQQVICDTPSLVSFLRGHSLCRDLWGNDRITNVRVSAAAALNVFTLDFTTSPNQPMPPLAREFLVGRTVVFKQSAQLKGEHALIVDYDPVTGQVQVQPPFSSVPQMNDVVAVLQRPFNGPGDRDLLSVATSQTVSYFPTPLLPPVLPVSERTDPNPLFPQPSLFFNFVFNSRHPETRLLALPPNQVRAIGGFDEPWDMADLQNIYLAALGTRDLNLDGILEPVVLLPSYWRPLVGPDNLPNSGDEHFDWLLPVGRMKTLRPRPVDHNDQGPDGLLGTPDDGTQPGPDGFYGTNDDIGQQILPMPRFLVPFAGRQVLADLNSNLDFNGDSIPDMTPLQVVQTGIPVDVDNDGDGILESIWIDPALPIVTRPDGTRAKPLAAILVMDLDSKFNLNVHGNNNLADAGAGFPYRGLDFNGDGVIDAQFVFGSSNQGASASEVNIGWAMAGKDGLDNDGNGNADDLDLNELAEMWYVLSGRLSAQNRPIPGRHGEPTAPSLPVGGPQAGLTGPAANPVDDDNDALEWRRVAPRVTEAPAGSGTYIPLASLDTAGAAVRRLFGIPDFDGNARHQLRPWLLTRWGTIRNPDDTHEPALTQTPMDLFAALLENFNEADEFDPYLAGPFDAPYNLTDLEWLLRAHGLGGNSISTRLRDLAPLSFVSPLNPSLGMLRRRHFTTQSWDWADYGLMPDVWRDNTPPGGRTLDDRWNRQDFTTVYNGYFDADGQDTNLDTIGEFDNGLTPNPVHPAIALGRRLNLNMPLGDGQDNDADGIVDELDEWIVVPAPSELQRYTLALINAGLLTQDPNRNAATPPFPAALNGRELRVLQAVSIYHLLQQIALPSDQSQIALDPAVDLPQLAQLAVNIVDFRDPDSEPTRMPGIQFLDTNGIPFDIYGVEYPALVLNETLAFAYEIEDPLMQNRAIVDTMNPGDFYVEVYNTGHPNRDSVTQEVLADYRVVVDWDDNVDNLPDTGIDGRWQFDLDNPVQPTGPTFLWGDQYAVLSNNQTLPNNAGSIANWVQADAPITAQMFLDDVDGFGSLGQNIEAHRWKVFLQRSVPLFTPTAQPWVTIDQFTLKTWVRPEPNPNDPTMFVGLTGVTRVRDDRDLVSRERREPYRGEPDPPPALNAAPVDPVTGIAYFEPTDPALHPANVRNAAVRNHPVALTLGDPVMGIAGGSTQTLGTLNWNSDVDDANGNKTDDDLGPQTDAVPTVIWPPLGGNQQVVGWDFLPWLDRDYANVGELMLAPGVAAHNVTALFREGGIGGQNAATFPNQYWYLTDFFEQRAVAFQGTQVWLASPRALHRLLEFTEVPSRQKGYQVATAPAGFENRRRRVPGKINLNTVQDPLVLAGLADHPVVDVNPLGLFTQWLEAPIRNTRNGADGVLGTQDDTPFIFGYDGADPADPTTARRYSLLRADELNAADPTAPIFSINDSFGTTDNSGNALPPAYFTGRTGDYRNPWFKHEVLRKVSGNVSARSNVFAVWITIGYFEVLEEPTPNGMDDDGDGVDLDGDGVILPAPSPESVDEPDELLPRLGREVGAATGGQVRHRVFYIVDRTRSSGFDPDLKDLNEMVIYRSEIE